jgi:hypothetical protein
MRTERKRWRVHVVRAYVLSKNRLGTEVRNGLHGEANVAVDLVVGPQINAAVRVECELAQCWLNVGSLLSACSVESRESAPQPKDIDNTLPNKQIRAIGRMSPPVATKIRHDLAYTISSRR